MSADLVTLVAAARKARAAGRATSADCNLLAWERLEAGDRPAAITFLEEAVALDPAEAATRTNLGMVLRLEGRLREAIAACDAAIAAAPAFTTAWVERGLVLAVGGSFRAARECYEQALKLDPVHPDALAGLATELGRTGDAAAARTLATRALARDPGNIMAIGALARAAIDEGAPAEAIRVLKPALAAQPEGAEAAAALGTLLGDACDKLDERAAAHAAYVEANARFLAAHAQGFAGQPSHFERVVQRTHALATATAADWQAAHAADAERDTAGADTVFVLGYPRSGNTLVENILASVPGASALEERPTLVEAEAALLAGHADHGALLGADAAQLADLRARYRVRAEAAGADPDRRWLVDMDPLKSLSLPVIARVLPAARVVWVRRDPRDVVWSCFHHNFLVTRASLEFTTLERTARHYAAVMAFTVAAVETLPVAVHVLDYHRLVADFEGETQALCAFTGMPWSEDLRRFDRTARARGVSTASARQVHRGLYDGRRQWERYAEWIAPVTPILAPWIERFGYS